MKKGSKLKLNTKLRKVGNSYVVTIPADFVERFELDQGDFLHLEIDPNEIKHINKRRKK